MNPLIQSHSSRKRAPPHPLSPCQPANQTSSPGEEWADGSTAKTVNGRAINPITVEMGIISFSWSHKEGWKLFPFPCVKHSSAANLLERFNVSALARITSAVRVTFFCKEKTGKIHTDISVQPRWIFCNRMKRKQKPLKVMFKFLLSRLGNGNALGHEVAWLDLTSGVSNASLYLFPPT